MKSFIFRRILSHSAVKHLESLPQVVRWLGLRCRYAGIAAPWIILWPDTCHAQILIEKKWQALKKGGSPDYTRVPRKSGELSFDTGWVKPFFLDQVERQYAAPCWVEEGLMAIVGFSQEPDALQEIESIAAEFCGALEIVHKMETLRCRIECLGKCVRTPDLAVAFANSRGDVLASTAEGQWGLGPMADPSHSFLKDPRITKLPRGILSAIRDSKNQMRVDERQNVVIETVLKKSLSTILPIFRVEVLTEVREGRIPVPLSKLTWAEKHVCDLAIQGLSNKEIAAARGCSLSTTRHQIAAVYRKTGMRSRQKLIFAHFSAARVPARSKNPISI